MSLRMSWDDVWTFLNVQDLGFLSQLDDIISSSTSEYVRIILKNAPQVIKERYNKPTEIAPIQMDEYYFQPLSEIDRQRLYASLGITDESIQKYKRTKNSTPSISWTDRYVIHKIINSLFAWMR